MCFCDEFHLGIGPQITKRIKRKIDPEHRHKPENVHRKQLPSKDTKSKAREEGHLKLLNVFMVIRYDYRKIIIYEILNDVGKMTTDYYAKYILPQLLDDFRSKGLTLYHDTDSAHLSRATEA